MTKEQLIELVNERVERRWHPDYVAAMLSRVHAQMIYEVFRLDPQMMIKYCKRYEVPVQENDGEYFSVIPANLIDVAGPTGGVRLIQTEKGDGVDFRPVTPYQWSMIKDLEVTKVSEAIRYWRAATNVVYRGKRIKELEGTNLIFWCLIPISEYEDEEDINIPAGIEMILVQQTLQLLMTKPVDDLVNDVNEKTK